IALENDRLAGPIVGKLQLDLAVRNLIIAAILRIFLPGAFEIEALQAAAFRKAVVDASIGKKQVIDLSHDVVVIFGDRIELLPALSTDIEPVESRRVVCRWMSL